MTDKIESKGKTVNDAVNEALLQMGARKDEVQIEVLDEPKSGLFGILGGKQARVLVTRKKGRGGRGRRNRTDQNQDQVTHNLSDNRSSENRGQSGGRRRRNEENPEEGQARGGNRRGRGRGRNRQNEGGANEKQQAGKQQGNPKKSDNKRNEKKSSGRNQGTRQQSPAAQVQEARTGNDQGSRSSAQGGGRRPRSRSRRAQNTQPNSQSNASQSNLDQPNLDQSRRESSHGANTQTSATPQERSRNDRGRGRGRQRGNEDTRNNNRGRGQSSSVNNSPGQNATHTTARSEQPMVPDEIIHTGFSPIKYVSPVRDVTEDQIDQMLNDFTNGVLNRAGFPIRCEVKPGEYRQVRITTDDSSAGLLIGRHGAAIDSVEHLVERMAGMAVGDRVRLNLDINNYRRRRQDTLQDRVLDAVEVVLEKERTFHMEPMNPRERRLVHLQVEKLDGVRTFTMGGGPAKHVVIAPDNGEDNSGRGKNSTPQQDSSEDLTETKNMVTGEEIATPAETEFDEFDDGPQPETNELVVDDDDDHRRLI